MKKVIQVLTWLLCICSISFAQRAKIVTEHVTPHDLSSPEFEAANSVSSGLDIVPNGTYVYLSAKNIADSDTLTNAVFTITSKPSGSVAAVEIINLSWVMFKPDVKGAYEIKLSITTAGGTHDTTKTIYSANYVGVGNFGGVTTHYPNCMTCHQNTEKFINIFDRWKVSGHANVFNQQIETSTHYSTDCMKCHTTGYDHNVAASNGGFDDVAAQLGWSYTAPSNSGKWDTLKTQFPGLVNLATIGCESCHGPGSEHTYGANPNKIQISLREGVCAQCHDEPWRHNKYSEYKNSMHSVSVWETTSGSSANTNSLNDCIRCHDGQGYVNFTKGLTTDARTWTEEGNGTHITCATCHDPHGTNETASLRSVPAGSDTLGNGYAYSEGGLGKMCMNCHKARRDNVSYMNSTISRTWGPHHSTQGDVLLGQNAAEFGTPYTSGNHKYALQDACVTCHMAATVDTSDHANRDKVGGHSFTMHNPETGYDHTTSCTGCHGPKTSFEDFVAIWDFDGDGTKEAVQEEIDGLIRLLRIQLPPVGIDTIDWNLIKTNDNILEKKAYWNYQLIAYDGSRGMHNTQFAVDVLTQSIAALNGTIPVELTSFTVSVNQNSAVLVWKTATETNNQGFEIQRKIGSSWQKLDFIDGKGTTTQSNQYSYNDKLSGLNHSGKVYYRLKQVDFDGTSQFSNEISIDFIGTPKNYSLSQNYPNPFNPSTTIKYTLPFDSNVKLSIYNIAGEVVKVLINNTQPAGIYDTEFNSGSVNAGLSSGIYFYSLEATSLDGMKSFRETKKMVLMK
jgi:hypothetical protein